MGQQPLYVAILWHMHQPYYKDLATGEYAMPWVRLHATKDYLQMPLIVEEFPNVQVTFNLVPSLMEQVEDYAAGKAVDPYLTLAGKRAEDLTEEERVEIVQSFCGAQHDRMIKPYPRFNQLYERRGWAHTRQDILRAAQAFSVSELRDLQAWYYLSWIDPLTRERDPKLKALVEKGGTFSEQEKLELLEAGREAVARVLPTYKSLWEKGQIEISTTPFYHPILPLIIDTDIARRARPKISLPTRRFRRPEDARLQIQLGLDYMEQRFGRRPVGMWPSEGSVCPELIPILQQEKIRWIATDEEVLACNLGNERFWRDKNGVVNNMDALYRPYTAAHEGAEAAIFFRDHFLSDLIGFKYMHWGADDAAADFIRRLEEIQFMLRGQPDPHVVSVILDGENCWEHYENNGLPFLRALYRGLSDHRFLKTIAPGAYLEQVKERRALTGLHSGSWINHDFSIWIGHAEDNASWDLLAQARDDIGARLQTPEGQKIPQEQRDLAWKSILIAEGSDWNWWYGDDHSSGIDEQFDALYRQHLINAYTALDLDPPSKLFIPIASGGTLGLQTQPCAFIHPQLDGRITNYYEWFSAGHYDPQRGGDSMHQGDFIIEALYFGFDERNFYLRVDLNEATRALIVEGAAVVVYLFAQSNFKIVCPLVARGQKAPARVHEEVGGGGWRETGAFEGVATETIAEFAFELKRFAILPNMILHFQVALEVNEQEMERCPGRAPLSTRVPAEDFEERMWTV